jgi:hypothetical protein
VSGVVYFCVLLDFRFDVADLSGPTCFGVAVVNNARRRTNPAMSVPTQVIGALSFAVRAVTGQCVTVENEVCRYMRIFCLRTRYVH